MDLPNKRQKTSSAGLATSANFTPLGQRDRHPHGARGHRDAEDRPHSKHPLPGYEPWILVKTKLRRRFVHNTETKQSLWRIPQQVFPGVIAFERSDREHRSSNAGAKTAEESPKQGSTGRPADALASFADTERRDRRRRSESLQREDEAAMLAELAAQSRVAEAQDTKAPLLAGDRANVKIAYDSEGSYEEIEVTDSEWEEEEAGTAPQYFGREDGPDAEADAAAVEFGEDDIAYQLAAMGEDHGLDPGEYGDPDAAYEDGEEGLPFTKEDAVNLFRDLLDDSRISPYTPWDKVIADESEASILSDDRYTVLPNMRARKEVWDAWAKDKAAQIKRERAAMEKRDPRIAYLAFLQEKATPRLYWPEFKRKYKRDAEMNDRKLSDKDREKLYRDHIARLKLPESTRKADLLILLKSIPLKSLNKTSRLDALPEKLVSHLHFIGLPASTRDQIVESHIRGLPPAPDADDLTEEQREEEHKRREERRRREQALAERERRVEEERRQTEKDVARARRDLREEERELERAMAVGRRGLPV